MRYLVGDIWSVAQDLNGWTVVPTNTTIRQDGLAVMGAGLAKDAAERFSSLPRELAIHIKNWRERLYLHSNVICLPTKRDWRDPSTMDLIENGCRELFELDRMLCILQNDRPIILPRIGCGLGGLNWERQVRPVVDSLLSSDRFILVNKS